MAHFDRFDICAAWNLYLQHHWAGQGDRLYARWCKLREHSKCAPSEQFVNELSENALEIYTQLCADAGTLERAERPIANPGDSAAYETGCSLFRMWHAAGPLYVWAGSFEQAFETLVEWLDDNAPGCLVSHDEAKEALEESKREHLESGLGDDMWDEETAIEAIESDNDWTVIGHTSLKTGMHICRHEWGGDEVESGSDEYDRVLLASTEVAQAHFLAQDRAQAIAECEEVFKRYSKVDSALIERLIMSGQNWETHPRVRSEREYNNRMRHGALVKLFCQGITGDES